MSKVILQVENKTGGTIAPLDNLVFEVIKKQEGPVLYNLATGIITFERSGKYLIQWWASTASGDAPFGLSLALDSPSADLQSGTSPVKTGQVNGFGVLEVTSPPAALSLKNNIAGNIYLSNVVETKASLLVTQLDEPKAFGAIYNLLNAILIGQVPAQVPMGNPSVVETISLAIRNALTMVDAGVYRVDIMLNGRTSSTREVTITLAVNDTPSSFQKEGLFYLGSMSTVYLTGFMELNEGDKLTLLMSADTDTTLGFDPAQPGVILSVMRVM